MSMISRLLLRRSFSSSLARYDKISNETLESLSEYLDALNMDAELSNGVLTVKMASAGTYVINRQPPNRQLWLSSPRSGPKRYELQEITRSERLTEMWQCERDGGRSLKSLLDEELSSILHTKIDCP